MTVDELFENYQVEAFRLETLPQYKVEDEWDEFLQYKERGTVLPIDENNEYFAETKQKIKEGKRHIRTRIIPDPISDYFLFETKAGYVHYENLGFEMYFLEQDEYLKRFGEFIGDFWLFDKKHIVMMEYGEKGLFISEKVIEDQILLEKLLQIREFMIEAGKPLEYVLDNYSINVYIP